MNDTNTRTIPRWVGAALASGAVVNVTAEAVVAAAWDTRRYSYINDYVNFLGSPFTGIFQGVEISSPLWPIMTIAWVITALLIGTAITRLAAALTGWHRVILTISAALQALGLIAFSLVPLGPATLDSGLLGIYLFGAFASIIFGNTLALLTGLFGHQIGTPRWLRITSITLSVIGLANVPLTYGWAPIGVAERISVYSYLLWALLTGITLLRNTLRR